MSAEKFIQGSIPEIMSMIKVAADLPTMIWGQPGLGKTKGLYGTFEEPDWKIIQVQAGCSEPTDLTGIPFNYKDQYAKYLVPWWAWVCSDCPDVPEEYKGNIILFLDDIVTAPEQTQAAFFKLVHEKRVGDYILRDNVKIVAAGNRLDDKSAASPMPMALANRFLHLEARVDADAFMEWGEKNGIHPNVLAFIKTQPQHLTNFDQAIKQSNEMAFATPRSWEAVSKVLHRLDSLKMRTDRGEKSKAHDEKSPINYTFKLVAGLVGKGIASIFNTFVVNTLSLVPPEEIAKDPENARVPKEKEIDITFATVYAAAHYVGEHNNTWQAFAQYALRVQPEFGLIIARACVNTVMNKMSGAEKSRAFGTNELNDIVQRYGDYLYIEKK